MENPSEHLFGKEHKKNLNKVNWKFEEILDLFKNVHPDVVKKSSIKNKWKRRVLKFSKDFESSESS